MQGIDPSSVNVRDLKITRPDRSGPGGDEVGTGTTLAEDLDALQLSDDRIFRRADGREIVAFARFFLDPVKDAGGAIVPIVAGDLAEWTDLFGVARDPQEIVQVEPIGDCEGAYDVLTFRVGTSGGAV